MKAIITRIIKTNKIILPFVLFLILVWIFCWRYVFKNPESIFAAYVIWIIGLVSAIIALILIPLSCTLKLRDEVKKRKGRY